MTVHFDWSVNFGQILQILSIVSAVFISVFRVYHLIDIRMTKIEVSMVEHAKYLTDHDTRLAKYEDQMLRIISDVQRIIGRLEIMTDRRLARAGGGRSTDVPLGEHGD